MKTNRGIIIPLYIYPDPYIQYTRDDASKIGDIDHHGAYDWQNLIACKKKYPKVPVIAVINPESGPGKEIDPILKKAFATLKDAGITIVGYVSTKYAGMASAISLPKYPIINIKRDIESWYRFYPMIDGIFFDEMARGFDPRVQSYYTEIRDFARSYRADLIVMNPGLSINHRWYDDKIADIFVTWEKDSYPTTAEAVTDSDYSQHASDDGAERGCLVIGNKFKKHNVKWILKTHYDWIYVTPYPLDPNPWDKLDVETLKKLFRVLVR
ncbi:MAG: hypothetical protein HQ557_19445 [Bacteroidetes bacterium]|nr:hypothetical protein [Bacteroidota bacterium]